MSKAWLTSGLALVAATAGVSTSAAQRTQTPPNVAGVWVMDTTKFQKNDAQLAALTLKASLRGDTLSVETEGVDVGHPSFTFTTRYLPSRTTGSDTAAHFGRYTWVGDTLLIQNVEVRPQRTLEIEERWTFDASRATLYRYQRVRDGTRLSQQTLVFTRQRPST